MKMLKKLNTYLSRHSLLIVVCLLAAIINVGCTLYIPIVIGQCVDLIIEEGAVDFVGLLPHLYWIAGLTIGAAIFSYFYEFFVSLLSQKVIMNIRNDTFKKINYLPLNYLDSHSVGDIISRCTSDVEIIGHGLLEGFKQLYKGVITIVFTLGFMIYVNYILAIVVFVLTPLSLFTSWIISKKSYKFFTAQAKEKGKMSGYVHEMLHQRKIVRLIDFEKTSVDEFSSINSQLYEVGKNAQFSSSLTNPTTRFVNGLVYAAVGIVGALIIISNKPLIALSIGGLSAFLTYSNQYTKPFNEISGVISEFQNAAASLTRIFEVLDVNSEVDNGVKTLNEKTKLIQIKDVSFSYSPERKLIEHFTLDIHKGEHIAIVGPTGCGKTTLVNLLLRFYDVNEGKILINGTDIRDMPRHTLRDKYSMVLQDTWLFKGSVFENITFGEPDISKDAVINICKTLGVDGFISRLPQAYDTIIDNGDSLSHGEKQLITIARIMINIPDIVILDEATSSIDALSEKKIQDAFQIITKNCTSFVIAHRLSTIKNADKILVMKDGNIIEIGSHNELMAKKGFYSELYNSQFEN